MAVDADLPGEDAAGFQFDAAEFGVCAFGAAGQGLERVLAVVIQIEDMVGQFDLGVAVESGERIGGVAQDGVATGFEEGPHVGWKRINGLIGDQAGAIRPPGERRGGNEKGKRQQN